MHHPAQRHPIQCKCGKVKGHVANPDKTNRLKCYCQDCQAFAHFLGDGQDILDRQGGTDIVQTLPKHVSFTEGAEHLACMRLTENGLIRWYASCCNTPIGNTLPSYKMSFVGLVHTCLARSGSSLDATFGPIRSQVNTAGAKGEPKPKSVGLFQTISHNVRQMLRARLDGSYKQTPFFSTESGTPIVVPKVLNEREYTDVMGRL